MFRKDAKQRQLNTPIQWTTIRRVERNNNKNIRTYLLVIWVLKSNRESEREQ